jgi:NAD(P)-dependent dehydrogenase (short-subunit alcohol dehydrogenase family)
VERLFQINVLGLLNVTRAFVPAMVKAGRGVIVNLSSGAGRQGYPRIGVYGATKYAVEGLTKSLAAELPSGLAAIPLSPGVINTEMLRHSMGEETAATHPDPETWVKKAQPFILGLGPEDNGKSLTVPQ